MSERAHVSFTRPDADGYRYYGEDWRVIRTHAAKGRGSTYDVQQRVKGGWQLVSAGLSYDDARRCVARRSIIGVTES